MDRVFIDTWAWLEFIIGNSDSAQALDLYTRFCEHSLSLVDCLSILYCKRHRIGTIATDDQGIQHAAPELKLIP